MTLSIVMLVKDRPRLTRQALASLVANTRGPYHLTIFDDGSGAETEQLLWPYYKAGVLEVVHHYPPLGPGQARNAAIRLSESTFKRPGLLYTTDNDAFFTPGWDQILLQCWESARRRFKGPLVLGGACHPFQQRGGLISGSDTIVRLPTGQGTPLWGDPFVVETARAYRVHRLEALGLLSWLWEWESWDRFGPFEPSTTINGSEDVAMCRKITAAGGLVGVVEPQVVLNCGVTSTNGKPCPGAALLYEQPFPEGVIVE